VEAYVYVDDKDIRRLRLAYDPQAVKNMIALPDDIYERGLATKKNSQGHIVCTALDGLVKEECSCGIYEARPRACREFAPGSEVCIAAREEAGLPTSPAAKQT
jgi:Fe-S-cluster containining protein